jgi:hypothetical protein
MPLCKLIALTTPVEGKEAEFNDWYNNIHLPEIVNGLGMKGAQRFKLVTRMMGADTNSYMALYDIELDDPSSFMAQMGEFAMSGKMTPSTASDQAVGYTAFYQAIGDYLEPAA